MFLAPTRRPGNWLENPDDATKLFVRQIYSEWSEADPGEVHIDRLGAEGDLAPVLTEGEMARRLRGVAADLRTHVRVWPEIVEHILAAVPANALGEPHDCTMPVASPAGGWSTGGSTSPMTRRWS